MQFGALPRTMFNGDLFASMVMIELGARKPWGVSGAITVGRKVNRWPFDSVSYALSVVANELK
jgi:hypothetical protein